MRVRTLTAALSAVSAIASAIVSSPAAAATAYTPTGGPTTNFVSNKLTVTLIEPAQTITCTGVSMGGAVLSPGVSRVYGADAASVGAFGATGCTNPVMGTTRITALTSPTLAIVGDAVSERWPARVKNVSWRVEWANCVFYLSGIINGRFDPATQGFTPSSGAVGLTIAETPAPPTGTICVTFDLQPGDTVALGGSFTNTSPTGSADLSIANP